MKKLENRTNAREIVREAGMSDRPEHYSGRGATSSDLNFEILEKVYTGIKNEHGDAAAEQFAQMVADIPRLTATDFLLTTYRLERNDWKWNERLLGNEKGIDVGPDMGDGSRASIGFSTIAGILGGSNKLDESFYIREQFLRNHGIKSKDKRKAGYAPLGYARF